jgi:hypothetical protein
MSEKIYTGGHDEKYLSRFQRPQGHTNNCGEFAVGAAVSILRDKQVDYDQVVELANKTTVLHSILTLGMAGKGRRLWPGGPTTPKQQVALAIETGKKYGLKLHGKHMMGTTDDLLHYLKQPDTAVLVTIGWDKENEPRMFHADGSLIKLTVGSIIGEIDNPFEAHVMLLAAHDPDKRNKRGDLAMHTPWGLLNWLVDGQDEAAAGHGNIFWMTDKAFQEAWRYDIPLVGSNMAVISKRPISQSPPRTRSGSMED